MTVRREGGVLSDARGGYRAFRLGPSYAEPARGGCSWWELLWQGLGRRVPAEGAIPPLGGGWTAPTASHSLVVRDLIPRWAGSGCPGLSGRWVGPGLPPLRAGTAAGRELPAAPVGRSRSCHGCSRTRCSRCPSRLSLSSTSHYLMSSSSTLINTARLTAALPAIGRRRPLRGTTAVSLVLRHDVCGPVPRRATSGA